MFPLFHAVGNRQGAVGLDKAFDFGPGVLVVQAEDHGKAFPEARFSGRQERQALVEAEALAAAVVAVVGEVQVGVVLFHVEVAAIVYAAVPKQVSGIPFPAFLGTDGSRGPLVVLQTVARVDFGIQIIHADIHLEVLRFEFQAFAEEEKLAAGVGLEAGGPVLSA